MTSSPELINQALQRALICCQSNQVQEAKELYQHIIQLQPDHPEANFSLGLILLQEQQPAKSLPYLETALDQRPDHGPYWLAYIDALISDNQQDSARQTLEMARQAGLAGPEVDILSTRLNATADQGQSILQPDHDSLISFYNRGDFTGCEHYALHVLEQFPEDGFTWKLLGAALQQQNRSEEAIFAMRQAIHLLPQDTAAMNNLGVTLKNTGELKESETILRQAITLCDQFAEAHNNLGVTLLAQGRLTEAETHLRRALQLEPEYTEAHCNLGLTLKDQGKIAEALASLENAVRLNPSHAEAHNNLGNILQRLGRLTEAETHLRQALAAKPDFAVAWNTLAFILHHQGRLTESQSCYEKALSLKPDYAAAFDGLLFVSNYHADASNEDLFQLYRQYDKQFGIPLQSQWQPHTNSHDPQRRLRIGYVSPAFYNHPVRHFLEPLLANHNKSKFEIFAYSERTKEDQSTQTYKNYVDHWVETSGLSDDEMAAKIRDDEIDILVDLAGHTGCNRLRVFARKPAPVSLHWLDFGYTTGLSAIDYYLTDIDNAPLGSEHLFSEQLWRLPAPAYVYRPAPDMGEVSPLPAQTRGYVTFGTLTRAIRINHRTLRVWSTILHRVKDSRLIIDSGNFRDQATQDAMKDQFAAHGIDGSRLLIGYHSPPWDVLRNMDISLDCFPHNSGTTLFESLYMGVPFITLAHRPALGRLGCSVLQGVGHPEWIATSEEEYIDKAVALAADLPRLAAIRTGLRQELEKSPLMDEPGFTRMVEEAYRQMFQKWSATNSGDPSLATKGAVPSYNLAITHQTDNRLPEAKTAYLTAINLHPGFVEAANNLGVVFQQEKQYNEAEACFLRTLALKPDYADAWYNLGNTYKLQHILLKAEEAYSKALQLQPNHINALYNLGNNLQEQGRLEEAEACLRQVLDFDPDHLQAFSTLLYTLNYHPDKDPNEIFQAYQEFNNRFFLPHQTAWEPHTNTPLQNRRLRVAYVAPDYRNHPARYFLLPLLAHHDRSVLEIYAYVECSSDRATGELFSEFSEHWIATQGMTDGQLSERIRHDAIDVLIDLAGHTAHNRLGVFAKKPAPVSLHWLDYGYTTGLSAIDYYLADPASLPSGCEPYFSEKPWRIATPALAYRPPEETGPVNALPAKENGFITFGTLTRAIRINHHTIRVWSEILKKCPRSRLIINSGSYRETRMQEALADRFKEHGIAREQLLIGCSSPPWDVLRSMDIGLDCFPHNSGTTLFESLYMGVPFITLADRPSVGRLGSSILEGINHPEWIAKTEDEYIIKALTLATDLQKLSKIRQSLRKGMEQSALMDEQNFVQKIEMAFHEMFEHWCAATRTTPQPDEIAKKTTRRMTVSKQKDPTFKAKTTKNPYPASPSNSEIDKLNLLLAQENKTEAIKLASSLTAHFPSHGFGWKLLGPLLHQQGLKEKAINAMRQAILCLPDDPDVHYNLGIALQQSGQLAEAESSYRKALHLNKNHIQAQYNLGNILKDQGLLEEAETCYRQILNLKTDFPEVHCNLGNTLRAQRRYSESIDSYQLALAISPNSAELFNNLGLALKETGKLSEAETACKQALKLKPNFPEGYNNLGSIYQEQQRLTEAETSYRQALNLAPHYAIALNNLGLTLQEQGRLNESEIYYEQALKISPNFNEAYRNRGILYQKQGRLADSESSYRKALTLKADDTKTLNNLAITLYKEGRNAEAETTCRMALELEPNYLNALNTLSNILIKRGQLAEAEKCLRQVLEATPDYAKAHSNLLFVLNYNPDLNGAEIFEEYKKFDTTFGLPWQKEWQPHTNNRQANRRLKVGYVAPQFTRHSARHFLEPLLAHHDKDKIEVYAYAELFKEDEQTLRYKAYVDHWVPTTGLSDAAVAARIREDGIDILVDLAGHTDGNRLEVFARKPAPVSLHWLDFGYTTGLTAIDYYLTDKATVPEGSEGLFSETPWRLETPALAYRPAEGMGDINSLPATIRGYVTFGTLTRAARINHRTIRVWSEILKQVEGSRLLIDSDDFKDINMQEALSNKFIAQGIPRERLEIGYHSPPWDILRNMDIGFDCFPHNSGTTLIETLYMGVPYITLAGRPSTGQLGSAILEGIGHPEWIAYTEEQYIKLAVALATDQQHLATVRAKLRKEMEQSPLMDEPGFTRKVEKAYQEMFAQWCKEEQMPSASDNHKAFTSALRSILNDADIFYQNHQFLAAQEAYQKALAKNPELPELHYALANTLAEQGQLDKAEISYKKALELKPNFAEAWGNLANTLQRQGKVLDAETCYQRSLDIKADFAEGYFNLGNLLREQTRLPESQKAYQKALQCKPDYYKAICNLGITLQMQGQLTDAEDKYREAITIHPNFVEGHINLGACLKDQGKYQEAEESYRNALVVHPDFALCYSNLGSVLKEHGHLSEAEKCLRRALEINPDYAEAHSNLLFLLNYHPDKNAEEIYEEYKNFNSRFCLPLHSMWQPHTNNRQTDRRLKIGYVSPQFRLHSIRHFFEPLLAHHNKKCVEIFAYAENTTEDILTDRYRSYVDHWTVTAGLSDATLAEKIRADGIDILIDLAGHTANNRLRMFALKPAPISLHWLDFGYTTGLTAIDYYLTDKTTIPEESENLFAETPWKLETPSFAYRPAEGMGEVSPLPATARNYVTFGTLTRAVRINHRTIRAWAKILQQVKGSYLVIDSSNFIDTAMQEELANKFIAHGIDRKRLEIGFHSPPWDVMRNMDISLDCFPHNSGTTLVETLYMGVPFITLAGRPSVGRLGCSILEGAGHPEWIANTEEEYIKLAVDLANDLPLLATLRAGLRQEMQNSPLMNEPGFASKVEVAYRKMFVKWCKGERSIQPHIETKKTSGQSHQTIQDETEICYQEDHFQEAESRYPLILESDPQNPDANYRMGCIMVERQQPDAALPYFVTAIDAYPEHGPFWVAYIDALDKAGQSESARQLLDMAIHSGLNGDEIETLQTRLTTVPIQPTDLPIDKAKKKPTKSITKNKSRRQGERRNITVPQPDKINRMVLLFQQGNFIEAESISQSLIKQFPKNNLAWKVLGAIRKQQGSFNEALSAMENALAIMPEDYTCLRNIAVLLCDLGRPVEAEVFCRRALAMNPDYADAHNTLGIALRTQQKLPEAEQSCRQALKLKPESVETFVNLGLILHDKKDFSAAETCYLKALQLNPLFAEAHCSLGITLQAMDQTANAESACRQSLVLKPEVATTHNALGTILHQQRKYEEAAKSYQAALSIRPDYPEAELNMGNTLRAQGRIIEAEQYYRNLLLRHPDNMKTCNNLGNILQELGRLDESEIIFRALLKSNPDYSEAFSNLLFLLNYHPDKTGEEIFREYTRFNEFFCLPLRTEWRPHTNNRIKSRRLKIGYVSPQFCKHPVCNFLEPLLANHNHELFETYAYAEFNKKDTTTDRYQSYMDHWVPTRNMTDNDLSERIRGDNIDILVDLAGHTERNRLLVFARKPAPISLHWLDFGYTTGVTAIDYYLTDKASVPAGSEGLFAEKPWHLETPCLAYRPNEGMGEINPLPAIERDYITFGSLSRAVRINHRTIRVWTEILKRVSGSHLMINSNNFQDPAIQDLLAEKFIAQGIARERLEIGYDSPPWDLLRAMDISLDCFPHNSGTTLIETLYMGVPFITLANRPSVGRLGCSILEGIGHPEWIAYSEEEYIEKSVNLAADLPRLAAIRAGLRQEMEKSPLMDEPGFARKVEKAYREMFSKWCEEQQ